MDQPSIWIPSLLLAHAFACIWLVKAALNHSRRSTQHARQAVNRKDVVDCVADIEEQDVACATDGVSASCQSCGLEPPLVQPRIFPTPSQTSINAEITLEWQGLGCSYHVSRTVHKVVLQDVWGKAHPGQMQALVGPSGAGKSTMLDMLAMRKSVGSLSGRLLANGQPATASYIRHSSYVPQEDTFIPTMSSHETLAFYAGVMLGKPWTHTSRKERVAQVLDAMGVSKSADTPVGGTLPGGLSLRGLSGGERRRLSIAAGILGEPSVLFLDEPTSGLDSFAALSVMGYLQDLAASTRQTVIATIHQPRSAIWGMFDKVSLLASARLLYHGPCDDMAAWFQSVGYTYTPGTESMSDWVLDLVATGFTKPQHLFGNTLRMQEDVDRLAAAFMSAKRGDCVVQGRPASPDGTVVLSLEGSTIAKDLRVITGGSNQDSERASGLSGSGQSMAYATGWWRQFVSLARRELANMTRNPFDVSARMLTATYVALIYSLFAYNSAFSTLLGMQGMSAYCFTSVMLSLLLPYISISLYTSDKRIYLADASAKIYRPSAYYMAKVLVSLPFCVLNSMAFSGVWYGMGSMRAGAEHFWKFTCIVALTSLIGNQVLHLSAIFAPNLDITFALSVTWTALQLPTCSFIIPFNLVHLQRITGLRYISAAYFAFEALMVNQFKGNTTHCSSGFDGGLIETAAKGFPNMSAFQKAIVKQMVQPQPGCIFEGDAVLEILSFSHPFYMSVLVLLGYLGVLHIITYLGLLLVARRERR